MNNNEYIMQDLAIAKQLDDYNKGLVPNVSALPQTQYQVPVVTPEIEPTLIVEGNVDKKSPIGNLANGMQSFIRGYNENKNNGFMPSNFTDNKFNVNGVNVNKGLMGKLGEAVGTISRQLNKPVVKGLVNGAISTALTGSPMFGFVSGTNTAQNAEQSKIYAKALKEQGIDVPENINNYYDSSDLQALMQPQYKAQEYELNKLSKEILNEYRKAQVQNQEYRNETDRNYKENRIKNEQRKINVQANKPTTYKPQNESSWKQDLADYATRVNDPRYADKLDTLKAKFIAKYGVDPDKELKY